eukprot:COSAG01_NODE_1235_length_11106_cov_3.058962_10_plen_496_part_00
MQADNPLCDDPDQAPLQPSASPPPQRVPPSQVPAADLIASFKKAVEPTSASRSPRVATKAMKKPSGRARGAPLQAGGAQIARRNSMSLLASKGFDLAAQMNVLTTFDAGGLDPERWEEALTKISPERLEQLAKVVAEEQDSDRRRASQRGAPSEGLGTFQEEDEEDEEDDLDLDVLPGGELSSELGLRGSVRTLQTRIFASGPLMEDDPEDGQRPLPEPEPEHASPSHASPAAAAAAGAPSPKATQRAGRRASVSFLQSTGIEGLAAEGILQTLSNARVDPQEWAQTLRQMKPKQLQQLAAAVTKQLEESKQRSSGDGGGGDSPAASKVAVAVAAVFDRPPPPVVRITGHVARSYNGIYEMRSEVDAGGMPSWANSHGNLLTVRRECPRSRPEAALDRWSLVVSRPFPSWNRFILTEIYLCHACSCQAILRTETAGQAPAASTPAAWLLVVRGPLFFASSMRCRAHVDCEVHTHGAACERMGMRKKRLPGGAGRG